MFIAINILSSAFQIYEIYLIYDCIFISRRVAKVWEFAFYFGVFLLLSTISLNINLPIINIVSSMSGLLILSLLYQGTWKRHILAIVICFCVMSLAESIVAVISGYVGTDIFGVIENYSYFGIICLPIVQYLFVLLLRNFTNLKRGEEVTIFYWIITIVLPIVSFYLYFLLYKQKGITSGELLGGTVAIFAINILVFFLYDRQIDAMILKKEKEQLELQNAYHLKQFDLMSRASENFRQQRHDFHNHLTAIRYYGEMGNWTDLNQYINDLVGRIGEHEQVIETGSLAFDAVLNYKIQEAKAQNIETNVEIQIPYEIGVVPVDVTTILGNLLDNAMDATRKLKDKWVNINIFYKSGRLNFLIKNPYDGKRIKENDRYLTNKKNKEQHGYGLINIEEVVNRYDGLFNVTTENNIFTVKIMLFL